MGVPMPDAYCLAPKDANHDSWRFSLTRKAVYVIAYDEAEARRLVGDSLYRTDEVPKPGKWEKTVYPDSPWRLPEVTSCERDTSGLPRDGIHIVAEDGEKWEIWRPGK
jgi:hypothetical protein